MLIAGKSQPRPQTVSYQLPKRAVLLPPLTLAGAAVPLVISSRPAVAELGAALAMLMVVVALLIVLLVPTLKRWLDLVNVPSRLPAIRK